jgi:hypothetical protein
VLAFAYVVISPPSGDLPAHLFRAKLFSLEGFGLWNNLWYGGHNTLGYSVLFPPVSAALTPQIAAAIAAVLTAALFEMLIRRHFGPDAWLAALWFGAATATNLYTGRLPFAFGLMAAAACALALQRGRPRLACALAFLTALCSPVAALFAGLAGAAYALGSYARARRGAPSRSRGVWIGAAVVIAALVPVGLLSVAFPEGGREPFAFSALWPIPVIAVIAFLALPRREWTLRAAVVLYGLGCIVSYLVPSPVGSNLVRLAPLLAGPLAVVLWWRRQNLLLLAALVPLLYLQWQAPAINVASAAGDPSSSSSYWQPLLGYLSRQSGPPFRIEIPFTRSHWEAYEVATRFPIARGWERQLDIKYNHLFYGGSLTAGTYYAWLRELAVKFVAVSDAPLDYSAVAEQALIDRGLPYLHLVYRSAHWRVYEVAGATPIVQGPASLTAYGPNSLTLVARRAGTLFVRVRFSPYWAITGNSGCVEPAGEFTGVTLRRPGPAKLVIRFSLGRIGANSPRCT